MGLAKELKVELQGPNKTPLVPCPVCPDSVRAYSEEEGLRAKEPKSRISAQVMCAWERGREWEKWREKAKAKRKN